MRTDHRPASRSGVVLLIVVSLASVLLVVMVAFLSRMRNTSEAMGPVTQEAQCRLMLHAALMYLQESSRLGWGAETYGWTDIRDGSLGPRPARDSAGRLPAPAWWSGNSSVFQTSGRNGFPEDSDLGTAVWPCPGSVLRISSAVWQEPPAATKINAAPNPISNRKVQELDWTNYVNTYSVESRFLTPLVEASIRDNSAAWGTLDPQPVADTWTLFQQGDRTARPLTGERCWFRLYRERLKDHDGAADGDDIWPVIDGADLDTVAISQRTANGHANKNWNVFIITVGAGASLGFRDWDEVVASGASGRFAGNRQLFEEIVSDERRQWWRVEWSASQGGSYNPSSYSNATVLNGGALDKMRTTTHHLSKGGNFKWIQRLDRAPLTW